MGARSVGVEEELLLVDPGTGHPRAVAAAVVRHSEAPDTAGPGRTIEPELKQEQIEVDTVPCQSLDDLRREVVQARRRAATAAAAVGAEVAALGTSPIGSEFHTTPKPRYERMTEFFGVTEWEHLICGCHVHVDVSSRDEAVAVLDRIRVWMPVLLALSANSPFAHGRDTSYASFRSQMYQRWPTAGPTELFGDAEGYDTAVHAIVRSGAAMDAGMMYYDARLSQQYPTVEVRVADVCLDADDTVLVAAFARALVETAARQWTDGGRPPPTRVDLLRGATWRAARHGLAGELLHPVTGELAPAASVVAALVEHTEAALDNVGDAVTVRELAAAVLARGSGAARQREVYSRTGDLAAVVADAVRRTTRPA